MSARGLMAPALASLCALAGGLLLSVPARAAVTHGYLSQIAEVPASSGAPLTGRLSGLEAMTVDSGHLWISEHIEGTSSFRVDEFNSGTSGFMSQFAHAETSPEYFGVAVGHLQGEPEPEVYLAEYLRGAVEGPALGVYTEAGTMRGSWTGTQTPAGSFGTIESVAVDDSENLSDWAAGDVYVPDPEHRVVDVFHPEADGKEHYVRQLTGISPTEEFTRPNEVAVDDVNGDVLVADQDVIDVFKPTVFDEYEFMYQLTGTGTGTGRPGSSFEGTLGVAVDGGNGEIYVWEYESGVVYQFSAAGAYRGRLTGAGTPVGGFREVVSVAVDPKTHHVYVGDRAAELVDVFGETVVVPDAETEPVSNVKAKSARLEGTVDPDEAGAAKCRFEWGTSTESGKVALCEPEGVPDGGSPVAVHADLSGLQPDTTYHYRLLASNGNGTNSAEVSQEFTTPGPGVAAEWVTQVGSVSASLDATIEPNGAPTTYYFQYGTSASYGDTVPVPSGSVEAGSGPVSVSVAVEGLAPGTVYHYRVVAVSEPNGELVTFEDPDETFTTQAAATEVTLPDGRTWEMVSPPEKQGVRLEAFGIGYGGEGGLIQAAEGGGALTYIAKAPIDANPPGNRTIAFQQYLATRAAGGWSTQDITTPNEIVAGVNQLSEYRAFSSDLSEGLVEPESATPLSSATSEWSPYVRVANGEYAPLVTGCPPPAEPCPPSVAEHADVPPGTKFGPHEALGGDQSVTGGVKFVTATPDFDHVVLASTQSLVKGFQTGGEEAVYEWYGGALQPVSVLPDEASASSEGGASVGYSANAQPDVRHALSADGERVFFATQPSGSERRLYMRDMASGKTVRLDTPRAGATGPAGEADFQDASSDGSKAFFTDTARLTVDATSNSSSYPSQADLYMCEVGEAAGRPTCLLKDLTVDHNSRESAGVQGTLVGAGEDGTYVYFVADGVLAPGAIRGEPNLYVVDTVSGEVKLVAVLSPDDGNDWEAGTFHNQLELLTARVSPSGRYLAFMSDRSLTGYDNHDALSGVPDEEVYEYDAVSARLVCVSCDPTGARPVGMLDHAEVENGTVYTSLLVDNPGVWRGRWLAGSILGYISAGSQVLYQPRYLDDSGRLFFNSPVGLVPQDANGKEDVYEFEPAGVGSCTSSTSTGVQVYVGEVAGSPVDGCVGLISSGTSSEESAFLDAGGKGPGGEEGEDVFFMTAAKLSPADVDDALDIYDAHTCSAAVPCPPAAAGVPPACTTAESCRAASPPQPAIFGAPSSETFTGAGDLAPPPEPRVTKRTIKCAKGKRRSHGRCVPKRSKKKRPRAARRATRSSAAGKAGRARRAR